ncbi:cell division protein FtsQ/DivIB [Thiomicrorhabdus chilensis]|uniref:cell division protein FtsQ/DivIB n=2 Tax=Thiomicrorhabdus chilensis TaxID=63656 RepID=UPI0009FBC9F2|nr:FtsQ-type POTRA domain-containing protein [Thiomicrorhabdus chilensis]
MKGRRFLWMSGLGLVLFGIAIWLLFHQELSSKRPIEEFHLSMELKELDRAQVDEVLEPYLGKSFWDVELNKIQADLVRLDWVSQAVVKRSWPDQLKISIVEQNPVARWGNDGLVNHKGEVFFPNNLQRFEHFVRLEGRIENSAGLLAKLAEFQQKLNEIGWTVERLQETANGVWEIHILDGPTLILDQQDQHHKFQRFLAAYPDLKNGFRKSAQVYDLRYSNGFAIKLKEAKASTLSDNNR